MTTTYDAIVIGGGHNGLTTACLLAKAYKRVILFERRSRLGGLAASEEFYPGYHSPGILHSTTGVRQKPIDTLQLERFGLQRETEPQPTLIPHPQSAALLLWRDPDRAASELSKHSKRDQASYRRYRAFLQNIAPVLRKVFDRPPPNLTNLGLAEALQVGSQALGLRLLGKSEMMELLRVVPMAVADWLAEYFESPLLQAGLAAPALQHTFTGPRSPGSTLNLLLSETIHSAPVVGGPPALVAALVKAAEDQGVEIRTDATVAEVTTESGRVQGIRPESGEHISAQVIAASCHPRHLFLDLLPPPSLPVEFEQNILNFRSRGTCAKVHLALSGYPRFPSHPDLEISQIRIGGSLEEMERAFDPVKYGEMSDRPILDIQVPTVRCPDMAPAGHHVFSILAHYVPYKRKGGWTEKAKGVLLDRVSMRLEEVAPGFAELLVSAQVLSPHDLETEYGVVGGHLLHGEPAIDQMVQRPVPECAGYESPIRGLYICGSGAYPGGGISCAPGAFAAAKVLQKGTGN
jgi:phytoene dehydrogenase-like protein